MPSHIKQVVSILLLFFAMFFVPLFENETIIHRDRSLVNLCGSMANRMLNYRRIAISGWKTENDEVTHRGKLFEFGTRK